MPALFLYLFKLSLCITAIYAFYYLVLRRLTFYNWNRWYFLVYSLLAFLIPLINVSSVLEQTAFVTTDVVQAVPTVESYTVKTITEIKGAANVQAGRWDLLLLLLAVGAAVLLIRLASQYLSYLRIRKAAYLIDEDAVKVYHVNKNIIPFSFGNSIFINQQLHDEEELKKIIQHEFIHVRQKHTVDIIWCEVFCILNWYNPFVWLFRKALRQNLEFIADHNVVRSGADKKQYQYLLLKVMGTAHLHIVNQFNFSSLKKRIAMMNKSRSTQLSLLRFVFMLPVLSIMLLSFRGKMERVFGFFDLNIPNTFDIAKQAVVTNEKNNVTTVMSTGKDIQDERIKAPSSEPVLTISGIIVDGNSFEPISGVMVTDHFSKVEVLTDEEGYYSLKIPIQSESTPVRISHEKEGYRGLGSKFTYDTKKFIGSIQIIGLEKSGEKSAFTTYFQTSDENPRISLSPGYKEVFGFLKEHQKSWQPKTNTHSNSTPEKP